MNTPIGEPESRTARRCPAVTTLMLLAFFVVGPCLAEPGPAPAQTAATIIDRACSTDMAIEPTSSDYSICTSVLGRMKARADQTRNLQQKRLACANQGLRDGTSAFATCVLDQPQQIGSVAGETEGRQ